jgi:hypothetical protein
MDTITRTLLLDNSIFTASLSKESFFFLEVKDDAQVGLESAIEYMAFNECLSELCKGPIPILTHSKGLISLDKHARKYIHGYKDSTAYMANAIVVERLASRAMMTFIMKLIPSSKFPELVFDSVSNASFWLGQEMSKHTWTVPEFNEDEFIEDLNARIAVFVAKERKAQGLSSS